jgi:arylsulfatase
MGDWKARSHVIPLGDGQWKLFNIKQDIREATDLSKEHPDILEKMVSANDKYTKEVGIIEPEYSESQIKLMEWMVAKTLQSDADPALPIED